MKSKSVFFMWVLVLILGNVQIVWSAEPDAETKENIAAALWLKEYDPAKIPSEILSRIESEVNSNAAFGERMRWNLTYMLANPDTLTPDYTELYTTFMSYATELTPHQVYGMTNHLGLDSSRGYKDIPRDISFEFPMDDRPQFEYQCGWHFFVGSAFGGGKEYGVQLMFWTQSILPPERAHSLGLSDIENQMIEVHFAITPAGDKHYRSKPTVVAGTTGLINFSAPPFNYVVGKNYMRSLSNETLFPIELRAWGVDPTGETPVEIEMNIVLKQKKNNGYVLNGDRGLAPSCGGLGTLYYSVPNLSIVSGKSWLKVDGKKARLSKGKFWYDHQWATGFMPAGNTRSEPLRALKNLEKSGPGGWDWLMIQFDDNTEFSLSALHSAENSAFYNQRGENPPGTMVAAVKGNYIDSDGGYYPVNGKMTVSEWVKSTRSYGEQYPATGVWYPNKADIVMADNLPEKKRNFSMVPIVTTGQQGFFAAGYEYSEGAAYIIRDGKKVGRGFMEAPGYDLEIKDSLRLSGLPDTEEMLDIIEKSQKISPELTTESEIFLTVLNNFLKLLEDMAACRGM